MGFLSLRASGFDGEASEVLCSDLANAVAVTQNGEHDATAAVELEPRQALQIRLDHEEDSCAKHDAK